jgi:hypothetical protein
VHWNETSKSPPHRRNSVSLIHVASRLSDRRSWSRTCDIEFIIDGDEMWIRVPGFPSPLLTSGLTARRKWLLGLQQRFVTGESRPSKRCMLVPSTDQMLTRDLLPSSVPRAMRSPLELHAMAETVAFLGRSSSIMLMDDRLLGST